MDLFESLDDAAAETNDKELTEAVAEVNACYDELSSGKAHDTESIFERLQKSSAIVRNKLAERDAKRKAATGLDDAAYKEIVDREIDRKVEELKEIADSYELAALNGDPVAEGLVEVRAELEAACGGENLTQIFKKVLSLGEKD